MKYFKAIVFSSNPVEGVFRFKNVFQLYPLNAVDAPKDPIIKIYPAVLEYCIAEHEKISLEGDFKELSPIISEWSQSANYQNRILRFLTAFSNYRFFFPRPFPQWFVSIDSKLPREQMNGQTSQAGLNMYRFPSLAKDAFITQFTDVDLAEIEPKNHQEYFTHLDLEGKEPVSFSQYIMAAFHNYFLLNSQQVSAVDSAVMLINQGVELRDTMKSLSFLSFISSIETMVGLANQEVPIERCRSCGQEQFKVMSKFRDYIYKYVSNNDTVKRDVNAMYSLRSKIVHEGMLLLGDGIIDWSETGEKDNQWQRHIMAMQTSRISLMNWLLMGGNK
jgi:hypothetical protein